MKHKEKSFNTEIARLCGTNAAIVATQLWEAQANADAAFYIDGYPWVRASYRRITAYLPFLTVHMVRTAVRKLRKEGIVKAGVYNKSKFDEALAWDICGSIRKYYVRKTVSTAVKAHLSAATASRK